MQNSAWQVVSGKHKIEKSMRGVAWPKDVEEQNKNAKANGVQIKWRTEGKTKDKRERETDGRTGRTNSSSWRRRSSSREGCGKKRS